jgi:hypothetical protein
VDLGDLLQRGSQFSSIWGVFQLDKGKFDRHKGRWTLMKKETSIIDRDGALMDSIILRSAEFSGCVAWKKPKLNISSH